MIAVYLVVIYIGQIGHCMLLVLARKPETKVRDSKIIAYTPELMCCEAHIDTRGWSTPGFRQLDSGWVGRSMGQCLLLAASKMPFLTPC